MKKLVYFIITCSVCMSLQAQKTLPEPLTPGAMVPDMTLENIINYSRSEVPLSDFRGKLLILDLWTTACPGCLKSFPLLQDLQKQFQDQVVIFPVSFGAPPESVRSYLDKRRRAGYPVELPTAVVNGYDHPLLNFFPTNGFPNIVWIDSEGKLVAITSSLEVSATNIRKILQGGRPDFVSSRGVQVFNRDRPLLVEGNGGADAAFRYRSMLSGYLKGLATNGFVRQKNDRYTRISLSNAPVSELVRKAVYQGRIYDAFGKQLVLEVADPKRYLLPPRDSFFYRRMDSVAYSYELILPPTFTYQEAYETMLADLCRYFRITAMLEKRAVRCWVLQRVPGRASPITKGGTPQHRSAKEDWIFSVCNRPLQLLVGFINKKDYPLILDETGLSENIDMDLRVPEGAGLNQWNAGLAPYGLKLSEEERMVEMLVIREKH